MVVFMSAVMSEFVMLCVDSNGCESESESAIIIIWCCHVINPLAGPCTMCIFGSMQDARECDDSMHDCVFLLTYSVESLYTCMVCVFVCVCARTHKPVRVCVHAHVCAEMCMYVLEYVSCRACACVCKCVCICVQNACMYVCIGVHARLFIYAHVQLCQHLCL